MVQNAFDQNQNQDNHKLPRRAFLSWYLYSLWKSKYFMSYTRKSQGYSIARKSEVFKTHMVWKSEKCDERVVS